MFDGGGVSGGVMATSMSTAPALAMGAPASGAAVPIEDVAPQSPQNFASRSSDMDGGPVSEGAGITDGTTLDLPPAPVLIKEAQVNAEAEVRVCCIPLRRYRGIERTPTRTHSRRCYFN